MKYISVQPGTIYYAWQVEVMLYNFEKMGVTLSDVQVLFSTNQGISREAINLMYAYTKKGVEFFFYADKRDKPFYVSSIRPNVLSQHFSNFPELEQETIFYHDCDIVFTKPIDWLKVKRVKDNRWIGSDTRGYIGYEYIKSKGEKVLLEMCRIMQLDPALVWNNDNGVIGAQYLMKGLTSEFWHRVERDSEFLYVRISALNDEILNKKDTPVDYDPLQIWCADMWALLWGAWRKGVITEVDKDFEFCWATTKTKSLTTKEAFTEFNIMHNAGVTESDEGLFFKGNYINSLPYHLDLSIDEGASQEYYKIIQEVEKLSVL